MVTNLKFPERGKMRLSSEIFKIENKAVGQKEKVGTLKERRAKARKEQTPKGTNYYSTANVKNKNKNKKAVQELKEKFSKGKKTGQRK